MKIALIHDWLTNYGGAERVLEAIWSIFPNSTIYTSLYIPKNFPDIFKRMNIKTSFLQHFPFKTKYRNYLPLMPLAFEDFDLRGYDLVISSCHACSKGVITKPETIHISYIHTPIRYVWDMYYDYIANENKIKRIFIKPIVSYLKLWDRLAAERVDRFLCNSDNIRKKIKKYYNKDATVIYPPVDTELFKPISNPSLDYYLIVSRFVSYKRLNLALNVFNELNYKLKIVGAGPEEKKLKKIAKKNIEFLGNIQDDNKLKYLYANCKALIFPGEEDFGLTPVEVQSCGRPVIGYGKGGLVETVINNQTGILFFEQTEQALYTAIKHFEQTEFNSEIIRKNALKFDKSVFKEKFLNYINSLN